MLHAAARPITDFAVLVAFSRSVLPLGVTIALSAICLIAIISAVRAERKR
jgi:hypothetical protein